MSIWACGFTVRLCLFRIIEYLVSLDIFYFHIYPFGMLFTSFAISLRAHKMWIRSLFGKLNPFENNNNNIVAEWILRQTGSLKEKRKGIFDVIVNKLSYCLLSTMTQYTILMLIRFPRNIFLFRIREIQSHNGIPNCVRNKYGVFVLRINMSIKKCKKQTQPRAARCLPFFKYSDWPQCNLVW